MNNTLKKHLINLRGNRLKEKLIVFESDDWGSIRIPDLNTRDLLFKNHLIKENDPFSKFDTLESSEDYIELFKVLNKYKDKSGRHPIITANFIINNPNFEEIKKANFDLYISENFQETYKKHYASHDAFQILQDGITKNLIRPQYHGSEHLNAVRWMKYLKSGDERFHNAFANNCFAIDEIGDGNRRHNLMAAYDYDNDNELDFIKNNIDIGLRQFENIFGFKSLTSIAPCYVWDNQIEKQLFENKVVSFQGSFLQNYPIPGKPFKKVYHYNGQQNKMNQFYFVRNGLFEPALNSKIDWVAKCMESIEIAFKWGKPAIIGTHRINFVGQLDKHCRNRNLEMFDQLLSRITAKWKDVAFLSSDNLLKYY